MAKIIFPDPVDYPDGWLDDNGQIWEYDRHGWIARSSTSGGGGDLPPVPPHEPLTGAEVLTAHPQTGTLLWENFNAGVFRDS